MHRTTFLHQSFQSLDFVYSNRKIEAKQPDTIIQSFPDITSLSNELEYFYFL